MKKLKQAMYGISAAATIALTFSGCREVTERGLEDKIIENEYYQGELKDNDGDGKFDTYTLVSKPFSHGYATSTSFLTQLAQSPEPMRPNTRIYMVGSLFFTDSEKWDNPLPDSAKKVMVGKPTYGN